MTPPRNKNVLALKLHNKFRLEQENYQIPPHFLLKERPYDYPSCESIRLDRPFFMLNIIHQFEDQLFRVRRHYLKEGSFASPEADVTRPDGMCDERSISLSGVTAKEFEILLGFFYSLSVRTLV